jgi:hypothetical protein
MMTAPNLFKQKITKKLFKFGFPLFGRVRKSSLPEVTLIVIDCVNYERARRAFDHCRFYCDFGAAKLLTHFDVADECVEKIEPLRSISAYSKFMLKDLARHFDTKYVLVAQWDGFVWRNNLWDQAFLDYDYIGAPWPAQITRGEAHRAHLVGNGGFSLRSKRLQEFLANDAGIDAIDNEDVVICQFKRTYLEQAGFRFAPVELAAKFSCEGELKNTFGQHGRNGFNMPVRPLWLKFYNLIHHGRFVNKIF